MSNRILSYSNPTGVDSRAETSAGGGEKMSLVQGGGVCPEMSPPPPPPPLGTLPSHHGLHHACLAKQLPSTHTCQSLRPHSLPGCPYRRPMTFRAALKPPHLKSKVWRGSEPSEALLLPCSITPSCCPQQVKRGASS